MHLPVWNRNGACVEAAVAWLQRRRTCAADRSRKFETTSPTICITDCPSFTDNCLNSNVLEASRWEYQEQNGPFGDEQLLNETHRYLAYRRFVYVVWHRLGKGNRKIIPACVAAKIKDTFPDLNNAYTGYKTAR